MSDGVTKWMATGIAGAVSLAVWGVAAANGYGWEMVWLPAVLVGAAWPRNSARPRCRSRRAEPPAGC